MDDHTLPLYTSEPRLPSYDMATSPTVSYAPSLTTSDINTVTSNNNYVFTSKSAALDLGPRTWGSPSPAYGYRGIIQGTLEVRNLGTVHKIVCKFVGRVTTTLNRQGIPVAPQVTSVLDQSIQLPGLSKDGYVLPPSYFKQLPGVIGEVSYEIQVEIFRRGWRSHETILAPFAYLPRTAPSHQPIIRQISDSEDWKLREYLEVDWESFNISKDHNNLAEFSLPRPLSYKAQSQIPFTCTISSTALIDLTAASRNLSVTLHKITSLRSLGRKETADLTLAKGEVLRSKVDHKDGTTTFFGMISGGRREGEMGWKVPNCIEVKYVVRVGFKAIASGTEDIADWHHEQAISLTTHSWAEFDGEVVREYPAMALLTVD